MVQFDDYHRTVVGYHGTRLSVAKKLVNREIEFKPSDNSYDWLGRGVYFWEYGPQQAFQWAEDRAQKYHWDEPIAVVASMIRLGFCFDLLDPYNVGYLKQFFLDYREAAEQEGMKVPDNANQAKYLDCEVFEYAYGVIESVGSNVVDTARAVYVPTGNKGRVWKRSWIHDGAHVQLCVRNPKCILGTWLHYSSELD